MGFFEVMTTLYERTRDGGIDVFLGEVTALNAGVFDRPATERAIAFVYKRPIVYN
jgi:hypothetical protein